jgi:hypothetical protein
MRNLYLYCAALLCILWLGYQSVQTLTHELFAVDEYICQFCPLASEATKEKINAYVAHHNELKAMPLRHVAQTIVAEFPGLKTVDCTKLGEKKVQLSCVCQNPLVHVNNNWVLSERDVILEQDFFTPTALAGLPALSVGIDRDSTPVLSILGRKKIRELDQSLVRQYRITWVDDEQVWMREPESNAFSILFSAHALPDKKTMDQCLQIRKELEIKGLITQQGKKRWVVDVRFANQIILSADTGGRNG